MKDLVENIIDMRMAGFSMETIANALGCSTELIEQALDLINKIEDYYESRN
jgi:uncharacterized protein (DUF433 family)